MAQDIVIDGTVYEAVETIALTNTDGETVEFSLPETGNVTLDTAQTITGQKTFTARLVANGGIPGAIGSPAVQANNTITSGDANTTAYTGVATHRKCANDGNAVNSALFFVNSDGTAKFCHRRGISGLGSGDDGYMLFDATGFKVAYSGSKGTAASKSYTVVDENNIATVFASLTDAQKTAIKAALGIT